MRKSRRGKPKHAPARAGNTGRQLLGAPHGSAVGAGAAARQQHAVRGRGGSVAFALAVACPGGCMGQGGGTAPAPAAATAVATNVLYVTIWSAWEVTITWMSGSCVR